MSTVRPMPEESTLRLRFAQLRRRIRVVAGVRGGGWLVAAVFLTATVVGLADARWRLGELSRAGVLVALLAGAAALVHRFMVQPLSARNDDFSLALRVEEQYPTLNDALASTVQFLDQAQPAEGASPAVRREAVRRALGRAGHCDFNKVIDAQGLPWAAGAASVALAVAIVLAVRFPADAETAALRLAAPFSKHEWPRDTQLALETPRKSLGSNQPFELRGVVTGVVPTHATIVFRSEGIPERRESVALKRREGEPARLLKNWKANELPSAFRVQVLVNDAESEEFDVKIIPPPKLIDRDGKPSPQITLDIPAYTDLETPKEQPAGDGTLEIIAGTTVTLRAAADRPLRRAWIVFVRESAGDEKTEKPTPDVVEARLEGDGSQFTAVFKPTVAGAFEVHLEDESDLTFFQTFELRLRSDPAPKVELERPSARRDVLSALPSATMTLQIDAFDAPPSPRLLVGALRTVKLRYRTGDNDPFREVTYFDYPAASARFREVPIVGRAALPELARLRTNRVAFEIPLPLAQFKHPDGTPLRAGDYLVLRAVADDFDDVTANKPAGESRPDIRIAIVDRDGLELAHNREQTELQNILKEQRDRERTAAQMLRELENRLKDGAVPDSTELETLQQMERMQREMIEKFGPAQLRAQTERIQESLRQNGMPSDTRRTRMEQVERELKRLADKVLPQAEMQLNAARRDAESAARAEDRARAAAKQAEELKQSAERLLEEAAQKEKAAAATTDVRAKEKLLNQANQARTQAKDQREAVKPLLEQANAEHQAAQAELNKPRPADKPKTGEQLAAARKREEEVEKTLDELLSRLEPSNIIAEIKGEARDIRDEQERQARELAALEEQTRGKDPMELTLEQKEKLQAARRAQQNLEERTERLLERMRKEAAERAKTEPELAEKLKEAIQQAEKDNITGAMREARDQMRDNQLNNAKDKQQKSAAGLESLARKLGRQNEAEQEQLVKKLREFEKELERIKNEADELRKKMKELKEQQGGTPEEQEKRADELKRLEKRAEELQKEAGAMAKKLTRGSRAQKALEKAAGANNPEEMLERLNEAERDLKRAEKEEQETLEREQLTRILEVIERVRDRQAALNTEVERLQKEVKGGGWRRELQQEMLNRVRTPQDGLREETEELVAKELANTPVFARMITRAAEAMARAGKRAEELVDEAKQGTADPAKLPDADLEKQQKEALRRLEQVIDSVKSQLDAPRPQSAKPNEPGADPEAGGSPPPQTGLPPLAQLKLLKALQKDVNRHSEEFKKAHADLDKLTDAEKTEYNSIGRDQQDVRELLEEMRRPKGEPAGDKPPEAKPEAGEKK